MSVPALRDSAPWRAAARIWNAPELRRMRISLSLLTERRLALYLWIDGMFLFGGLAMAFGGGESAKNFYVPLYLIPLLLIAVPVASDAVAIERRSGTLDLALTSPGSKFYFERRVTAIAALVVIQGWVAVILAWLAVERFPLALALVQIVVVATFVCAVVLNWAARFRTAGAVIFATYAVALAFGPWFFSNPVYPPEMTKAHLELGDYVDYVQQNLVLAAAAVIFYLYARQRLSRPEVIIA